MAEIFTTHDVAASVRQCHAAYTHVVLNRVYAILRPIFFKSDRIADLPIHIYAGWDRGTFGSKDKWRKEGGILIDRSAAAREIGPCDAQIFCEVPLSFVRFERLTKHTESQIVVFKPPSWATHESAIDFKNPPIEALQKLRAVLHDVPDRAAAAAVSKYPDSLLVMTDSELGAAAGIPAHYAMWMRASFKPEEIWQVKLRLKPEDLGLVKTWDAIEAIPAVAGTRYFHRIGEKDGLGWRRAIKELARLGHISAMKLHVYPTTEPDYEVLHRKRDRALKDFEAIRTRVDSAPAHL